MVLLGDKFFEWTYQEERLLGRVEEINPSYWAQIICSIVLTMFVDQALRYKIFDLVLLLIPSSSGSSLSSPK